MAKSLILMTVVVIFSSSDAAPSGPEMEAHVVETPSRIMTVQPLSTFNHGKPFLAERDPVTGAFDLRTTSVDADDYMYEEFEDSGESIDRKDEGPSRTANHIINIPSKDSELHKFLNLPVHYSSASKFPLISSSYANTKIQGHGVSNHRPAVTTSTPSTIPPSYYPHRPTASTTTTATSTSKPVTTQAPTQRPTTRFPSTTTSTTTAPPPAYEYEYEYDYNDPNKPPSGPPKADYDFMGFLSSFGLSSTSTSTTTKPIERSTTTSTTSRPSQTQTTTNKLPTTEDSFTSHPSQVVSTTRLPSTTSQHPKVENEPKPSISFGNKDGGKISSSSYKESDLNKSKYQGVSSLTNKTDLSNNNRVNQKEGIVITDVPVGLKPPVKTPDSVMKPPPRFGDKIEVIKTEDNMGWRGKPELSSSEYLPSKPNLTTPSTAEISTSTVQTKPLEPKPEGSNQVKYSVNRPHVVVTKKPIEFHQHLVSQMIPTGVDKTEEKEKIPPVQENPKEDPQVVVPVTTTSQGLQFQRLPNEDSSPSNLPVFDKRPIEVQGRPPVNPFPEEEHHRHRPQNYGTGQVYHATVQDEKAPRPPASTYIQRPLGYGTPAQPPKENTHIITGQVEPDDNVVFNKVSYRPQPGLVSSYQPQPHTQSQPPPRPQPQPQSHQQPQPQSHHQPQPQTHSQPHPQQRPQPHPQPSHTLPQGFSSQTPLVHQHKVPQQAFSVSNKSPPSQPSGQEEVRPIAWPPKGTSQDSQKVPPFAFYPRPEQRPDHRPPTGVGTVEAVRPPNRPQNKGAVAVSSLSGDTQSYSLQTSFAIGVPSAHGDESPKVTAGTVTTVPVGHQPSSGASIQVSNSPPVPPAVATNTIKYPPPPWEGNLNKPYKESIKRKPLPNILPQFRPNAKMGIAEPSVPHLMGVNYMREPIDRLQPPPPPLPPQPRPVHRSEEQYYAPQRPITYHRTENPSSTSILPPQPVHRRNGVGTKVSTLQMIQSPIPGTSSRKPDEPVMIVYPSNNAESAALKGNWRQPSPDFGNDDEFPHDLDDARTKDTPILKGKPPTAKPPIKVEFPYPLVKPLAEGEIKEYQAYVPTSTPADKSPLSPDDSLVSHHLQDYLPSLGTSSAAPPPKRIIPGEAEFGWSVIGSRADDDLTTSPATATSSSTTGPMAPPLLTGGFRPIPAPKLD